MNSSTTPKVQAAYADGSDNHIRPTSITYPDGRMVAYDYGAAGLKKSASKNMKMCILTMLLHVPNPGHTLDSSIT